MGHTPQPMRDTSMNTNTAAAFAPITKRERIRSEGQEARHGHRVAKRDRQQSLRQDRGQKRAQAFA